MTLAKRVGFDYRKACWWLVEVWIVRFDYRMKCVGGFKRVGYSPF